MPHQYLSSFVHMLIIIYVIYVQGYFNCI